MAAASCSNKNSKVNGCVPCEGLDASAVLPVEQVQKRLSATLPLWSIKPVPKKFASSKIIDNSNNIMISKSFTTKDFQAALDALNAMGAVAETEGHHPDFHLTSYRNVQVDLYTHSVRGITENDLTLALLLDRVPVEYGPNWLREFPSAAPYAKNPAPTN